MDDIKIRLALEGADQVQSGAKKAADGLTQLGAAGAQAGQQTQLSGQQLAQVSAQLQDFFVQVQGGQAPLTALLQQGSQLSAVFGGVGNAAQAVASLITPTVALLGTAAVTVGVLAKAYSDGAAETQAYSRALILTGNAAGMTVGQLNALARAQSQIVGTQGEAAKALAALAATGQITGDAFIRAGEAATRLARVGVPLEETVKKFASLGKEPLKAVIDLNEAENFLTESVYKQIKALSEQGKLLEAAALAQTSYADVGRDRAEKLTASLGTLQRAWAAVGTEAAKVWDRMLGVGRAQTTEDRIKTLQAELEQLDAKFARQSKPLFGSSITTAAQDAAALEKRRAGIRDLVAELFKKLDIERLNAQAEADGAQGVKTLIKANEDAGKAAKALAAERDRESVALEKAIGLSGSYQKDLIEYDRLRRRGLLTEQQYVKAVEDLIKAQPMVREQLQAQADADKQVADAMTRGNDLYTRQIEVLNQSAEAVAKQVLKLREEEEALALVESQNITLAQAIEQVAIKRLQEQQAAANGDLGTVDAIQREIDARRELATLMDSKAGRDAAKKSAEEAAREWKRASDEVERTITDSLMRGFEAGKGFGQTLRDTLVASFKALVLRPTIQAIVQPVAGAATGLLGSLVPGLASASTGGTGASFGGGLGGLGGFGSLFSSAKDWTLNFGGSASVAAADLGSFLYNQGFESAGRLIASNSGAIGDALNMGGNVLGYGNALYSLSQGKYGTAAGSAIGTYFGGPIGSAIGSAIGGAIDKAFGSVGTNQRGGAYLSNGVTGQFVNNGGFGLDRAYGDSIGKYFSQSVQSALQEITGAGAGLLNSVSTAFGGMNGYQVGAFFASDNNRASQGNRSVIGPNGQILSSWSGSGLASDPTTGLKQLTNALASDVKAALEQINIPMWAQDQLKALSSDVTFEQLGGVAQSILTTQQALVQLGEAMPQLSSLTDEAVSGLLKAMGGIEGLKASASAYYDAFYSDAEKNARATAALGDAMARLGLQVPTTREGFRKLVEAQDLTTESGRAAYAELLKLSPAFAALVPATIELSQAADTTAADLARAAERMAEAGRRVLADLAGEQTSLQVELLRAQGNLTGAADLARQQALAKLIEGLSAQDAAAATAAYDFNAALRAQIDALTAAKAAAEQAAQAEAQRQAAILQQREGIQSQIDQLTGNTAAIRARELAALDETNRALQQRLYALQDEAAAAQAAAQAAQELAAKQAAIAQQRDGIQARIDELTGNTAAIRERELAGLDESNRALQQRVYALQDEAAAAQLAAQAAQELAAKQQAVAQQRDSIQARIDELKGDTAAIRARELAGLDASNRALQEQYYALLDAKAAAEQAAQAQAAANQAAQQAAQAAEQVRNAWRNVSDSLLEEVARLRGQSAGQGATGLAAAQTRFAVATAQARAGDQEAAKLLPALSRNLLELFGANARTRAELDRAQAQIAASLESTASTLGSMFGFSVSTGAAAQPFDVQSLLREVVATAPIVNGASAPQQTASATQNSMSALVDEVRALRAETEVLRDYAQRSAAADERTRDVLVNVTEGGRAMQVENAS